MMGVADLEGVVDDNALLVSAEASDFEANSGLAFRAAAAADMVVNDLDLLATGDVASAASVGLFSAAPRGFVTIVS